MAISSPEELTVGLFERGLIGYAKSDTPELIDQPGGFRHLKSGRLSPTYVDLRPLTSTSRGLPMTVEEQLDLRDLVITTYGEVINENSQAYDHLMGIPVAAAALTSMVALHRRDSLLPLRPEQKEYGTRRLIEGNYLVGEEVVVLDDVITDGASKFDTLNKVQAVGLAVQLFVVLVDREEGGRQTMEKAGLSVASAIGMGGITAILAEQRMINDRQVNWTAEYYQKLVDSGVIEKIPSEIEELV